MNEILPDLQSALKQLIREAESPDGVTGDSVRLAYRAESVARSQLSALQKILRELNDNGITQAAFAVFKRRDSNV